MVHEIGKITFHYSYKTMEVRIKDTISIAYH
jgi:hypothetical protein